MKNLPDISAARLINQQIVSSEFTKAKDLLAHMGAVQSQDYAMSKWAIGLRVPGSTEKRIEKALDKGDILRTHVLRPTWHLIPAADIYWMLSLSAGKIKALMKTMDRQLELTEKIFTRSNNIIAACVEAGGHVERDTIAASLEKGGISLQKNRLSHLLIRAELDQLICSGKMKNDKRTYALLPERVPIKKMFSREESLAILAKKYFTSRGPATIADFSWWAGLSLTDAKNGLELAKSNLVAEKINGLLYWCSSNFRWPVKHSPSVYLLPAYDEFIISYKDRTASMASQHHKKVLGVNGIFNPVIIVNGQVTGLWKRQSLKDGLHIETAFFNPHNKLVKKQIEEKAAALGLFTAKPAAVTFETRAKK